MAGAGIVEVGVIEVKFPEEVAFPLGVVTTMGPLASDGIVKVIFVSDLSMKGVLALPIMTLVAPVKLLPLTVTLLPIIAELGLNPEIVGAGANMVKGVDEVAVPPGVVMAILTGPGEIPFGTVVVIWVSPLTAKVAEVPDKETAVAPVNPEPVTTILVPLTPERGWNPEITGVGIDGGGGGGGGGKGAGVDAGDGIGGDVRTGVAVNKAATDAGSKIDDDAVVGAGVGGAGTGDIEETSGVMAGVCVAVVACETGDVTAEIAIADGSKVGGAGVGVEDAAIDGSGVTVVDIG